MQQKPSLFRSTDFAIIPIAFGDPALPSETLQYPVVHGNRGPDLIGPSFPMTQLQLEMEQLLELINGRDDDLTDPPPIFTIADIALEEWIGIWLLFPSDRFAINFTSVQFSN